MRLFLIRHPPPHIADGICYGRTDLGLAADVAPAVARLRALLPAAPIYSSPLERCRLLAHALDPAARCDERLREIDFGDWEMRRWDDIDRAAIDAWAASPLDYNDHGGESVAMLRRRVAACVVEIAAHHDTAVLVVHAGVMKAAVAEFTDLPAGESLRIKFEYGTVSLIEAGRLVWQNR